MNHLNSSNSSGFWATFLLFLSVATTNTLAGQVSDYSFSQTWNSYTPITGTVLAEYTGLTGIPSMDDVNYNIPDGTIPFTFIFDGNGYTGVNVSSNGFLTFGATLPGNANYVPISSATAYMGAVAAFGRDLQGGWAFTATRTIGSNVLTDVSNPGPLQIGDLVTATGFPAGTVITGFGAGTIQLSNPATTAAANYTLSGGGASWSNIRYETIGSAPNRTFVVQWSGFKRFGSTVATAGQMTLNFQIRLNEADMSVDVVYGNCSPGITTFATSVHQVGLRGQNNAYPTNVNNRQNTKGFNDNWLGSEPGLANNSGMIFNNVDPANVIVEGLTYR